MENHQFRQEYQGFISTIGLSFIGKEKLCSNLKFASFHVISILFVKAGLSLFKKKIFLFASEIVCQK